MTPKNLIEEVKRGRDKAKRASWYWESNDNFPLFAQRMVIVNAADTLLREVERTDTLRLSNTPTSNIVPVQDEEELDGDEGQGTDQEIIEVIDASFQPGISHNTENRERESKRQLSAPKAEWGRPSI